jgi:hypothetical protein
MGDNRWFAVGEVLLNNRDHSVLLVDRFLDDNLIYEDEVLSHYRSVAVGTGFASGPPARIRT